ncbi:hypothetical protein [Methylomonas sp. UP202]|uniref:hypothetical protein n=1 Tax=Methylomonas sp. UP202 TaxID=3040943 RepID=UPI002478A8CB|nr:hypothetical protein [Methylomonas sp. UP202]WGS87028.1 hypothetical protein QC632_04575 [Methylomonas sp. UP202]
MNSTLEIGPERPAGNSLVMKYTSGFSRDRYMDSARKPLMYRMAGLALAAAAWLAPPTPALAADAVKPLQAVAFSVADDNLRQFGFALESAALADRVRANLAEWEFPLPGQGPFSHALQAKLGKVARRETPVGFSFSSGNSDPRAAEFQKADVLPITCTLRDAGNQAVLIERESTFSAHAFGKDVAQSYVIDKLVDQISTACLDVLEHAPLPKTEGRVKTALFKPKWMPDVRVEVREIPAAASGGEGSGTPAAIGDEPKKEVIIHNQGNPVIFTFGHERK